MRGGNARALRAPRRVALSSALNNLNTLDNGAAYLPRSEGLCCNKEAGMNAVTFLTDVSIHFDSAVIGKKHQINSNEYARDSYKAEKKKLHFYCNLTLNGNSFLIKWLVTI